MGYPWENVLWDSKRILNYELLKHEETVSKHCHNERLAHLDDKLGKKILFSVFGKPPVILLYCKPHLYVIANNHKAGMGISSAGS